MLDKFTEVVLYFLLTQYYFSHRWQSWWYGFYRCLSVCSSEWYLKKQCG